MPDLLLLGLLLGVMGWHVLVVVVAVLLTLDPEGGDDGE